MDSKKLEIIDSAVHDYRVIKKEELSRIEDGYIGKRVYNVTLYDGTTRVVEQITKNKRRGDAVVIIPMTVNDEFVMIIESRPNIEEGYAISFPSGMVDEGEEEKVAAERELLEETGFMDEKIEELEEHYQDQGCSGAVIKTFLATGCKWVSDPTLDGFENLRTILLTYKELLDLWQANKIKDANSKIAFMTYELKRRKK
ncbi:MAG: NUDIX hydrolase [Ruminococcus sp.]|nr:NUDIX hydrolase [Ruminococcus sp.]